MRVRLVGSIGAASVATTSRRAATCRAESLTTSCGDAGRAALWWPRCVSVLRTGFVKCRIQKGTR